MTPNFADRLQAAIHSRGASAVVGIDPTLAQLPASLRPPDARPSVRAAVTAVDRFCREIIGRVAPLVPAIKINSGFFEAFYEAGIETYFELIGFAHLRGLLVIADVKRGDIGSTARLYAQGHIAEPVFADLSVARIADAVTLAGYLGENAVRPFIDEGGKSGRGVYILVRPSDPGADEIHEFRGAPEPAPGNDAAIEHPGLPFYMHMASLVRRWGSRPDLIGSCGLSCVGAVVAPKDAATTRVVREAMPLTPFLVPGYGAQGATADSCRACFLPNGTGAIVNASRSVIYAFENPKYRDRFGHDWASCIEAACGDFVADLKSVTMLPAR